jgi:hypothetical protein
VKCTISNEDIAEQDLQVHIVGKYNEQISPWKYIIALQKRLEQIEANIEKSHGPTG